MKKLIYRLFLLLSLAACEQEDIQLTAPETPPPPPECKAGSANFTKFVAIGSSYTAGFQAGALFTEGQNNSLGKILATQFSCAGGGTFNQPTINSEHGFNIFITPNPVSTTVLGRFKLQGTPPAPAPVISGMEALPSPLNPVFVYTGAAGSVPVNQLNNFGVQAVLLAQAIALKETGNWNLADTDPSTPGAQPHPYFNPFYARFASSPSNSTLFGDAISSLTNGGTFFLFWLGMDDFLLHAVYGGDPSKAPLTPLEFQSASNPGFKYFYNTAIQGILQNPTLKGVIANYPDIFVMPHFTSVRWNVITFTAADQPTIDGANSAYAPYNGGLDAAMASGFPGLTQQEVAKRKIQFKVGSNGIVIEDETLTNLSAFGLPSIRQTTSADLIPLAAGAILGTQATPGNPSTTWGVGKALTDQYALIPSEISEINARIGEFNAHIKAVADANPDRLAFADVNLGMKSLVTAQAGTANNVTFTPNINPPTGLYSEEGLHPNSRGYAFIANIFIDAINAKFGATIPKANLGNYSATPLPINP
jgi:hypothetical protein